MVTGFSAQSPGSHSERKMRLSRTGDIDSHYNWKTSPVTRCEMKVCRKRNSRGMFVVTGDSVIDHLTATNAAQNDDCTRVRRQGLGYEPEISMGAPAFRYCKEMAVNDRWRALLSGRFVE